MRGDAGSALCHTHFLPRYVRGCSTRQLISSPRGWFEKKAIVASVTCQDPTGSRWWRPQYFAPKLISIIPEQFQF